jgi:hypothetical protein
MEEMGISIPTIRVYQDNQAVIKILESEKNVDRTRHEMVKIEYLRELVRGKKIDVYYKSTDEQVADIFTKSLGGAKFELFSKLLNLEPGSG